MPQIIIYVLCAIIAIGANILLGGAIADFKNEWDKDKCILGLKKAGAVLLAGAGLYGIGVLMPELIIEELNLSLSAALMAIAYSVVVAYVVKDIDNLMKLLNLKSDDIKPRIKEVKVVDKNVGEQG